MNKKYIFEFNAPYVDLNIEDKEHVCTPPSRSFPYPTDSQKIAPYHLSIIMVTDNPKVDRSI